MRREKARLQMSPTVLFAVTLVAALGCGLMAGIFFAFSFMVMGALARLPPAQGIAAMQQINDVVINDVAINPWFGVAFFGTALVCAVLAVSSLFRWQAPGSAYLLVGGLFYLVGAILVTIAFNVPRNNALAALDPVGAEAARYWIDYLTSWTAWNHVRTATSLAAAASLTIALCQLRASAT
jgi:uncharacterized membrane protein